MSVETMARLARHPNIVGVKDATANLARPLQTRRACGAGFTQLSGEDHTAVVVPRRRRRSAASASPRNVAPRLCSEMQIAWAEGRASDAITIQDRLLPLHDALFVETSPAPGEIRGQPARQVLASSAACRSRRCPKRRGAASPAAMTEVGLLN